jgi:hypothetical protein
MRILKSVFVLALMGLQWTTFGHAGNIALGKPVSLIGEFGTGSGYLDPNHLPPLPPASIVTDGVFQGGYWTNGVWWDEGYTGVHNFVAIDLLGEYKLRRLSAMVDNNDRYLLEYRDPSGNWASAWEIPDVAGFGLMRRTTTLSAPITATALRLSAFAPIHSGMDTAYSVSEIQAFGTPLSPSVPEPSSVLLFGIGLVGLYIGLRRRIQA